MERFGGMLHMQGVFKACKKLFGALPLAAVIAGQTLVLHGGVHPDYLSHGLEACLLSTRWMPHPTLVMFDNQTVPIVAACLVSSGKSFV